MEYLKSVELIRKIEDNYLVMDIKYKNVSIWPFVRVYLMDSICLNKEIKLSKQVFTTVIKAFFAYNVFRLLKKYDFWTFTAQERRKRLGDKRVQRVCGVISDLYNDRTLFVEKPSPWISIVKRKEMNEKHIISESLFFILTTLINKLTPYHSKDITGTEIIDTILKDYNLKFDYRGQIHKFVAQYRSMKTILKIAPKPKVVFIECPYSSFGYVLAWKEKNIPVVELQHGVVNEHHDAYNSKYHSEWLYPDSICVYGQKEYEFFTKGNNYCNDVNLTGYYFLDKANRFFDKDTFEEYREKYKYIIVVAGQTSLEDTIFDFCKTLAEKHTDLMFFYVPRDEYKREDTPINIEIRNGVNIYQYLKWCDIHVTINSTTLLESQFFKKPSILFNFNDEASTYYGNILNEENGCFYIKDEYGFGQVIEHILPKDYHYLELFADNCDKRIAAVAERYSTSK